MAEPALVWEENPLYIPLESYLITLGRECFQIPLSQEVYKLVEDFPSINLYAFD